MANLSDTVKNTRRIILGFLIFSFLVLTGQWIIAKIGENGIGPGPTEENYYLSPNAAASSYSRLLLKSLTTTNQEAPEFVKVGDFPTDLPNSVNVYNIKEKKINLSTVERASRQAEVLELNPNYQRIDANIYRWSDEANQLSLEYNRETYSIKIRSDLLRAAQTPIVAEDLDDDSIIQTAKQIVTRLEMMTNPLQNGAARIDYAIVGQDRKLQSVETLEEAQIVRVILYESMESATVKTTAPKNIKNPPESVQSMVRRPDYELGSIVMYLNGEVKGEESLVWLDFVPFEYVEATTTDTQANKNQPYDVDIYPVIEVGTAFEMIKAGRDGAYLAKLYKRNSNAFEDYTPLNVKKFSIDAAKTRVVYIQPDNWEHLNPDVEWDAHLYPYYLFEGVALLDNGEADFAFLVDIVPQ